jgi:hypothetical protein
MDVVRSAGHVEVLFQTRAEVVAMAMARRAMTQGQSLFFPAQNSR